MMIEVAEWKSIPSACLSHVYMYEEAKKDSFLLLLMQEQKAKLDGTKRIAG